MAISFPLGLVAASDPVSKNSAPSPQPEGTVLLPPFEVSETPWPKILTEQVLTSIYRPLNGEKIALAPDGKHVAFTSHAGDKIFLLIIDFDQPEKVRSITVNIDAVPMRSEDVAKTPARLRDLHWVDARRLIFTSSTHEIMAVDYDGQNGGTVVDEKSLASEAGNMNPHIIALPPEDPEHIIVQALGPPFLDTPGVNVGYRVDPRTRKVERIWMKGLAEGSYIVDRQGFPRLLQRTEHNGAAHNFSYMPTKKGAVWEDFETVLGKEFGRSFRVTSDNYYGQRSIPLGFDYDPNVLYYASNVGRATFGIYSVDVRTKRRTTLLEDPDFDGAGFNSAMDDSNLVFDRKQRKLVGIRLAGLERRTRWLDPEFASIQKKFDRQFPQRNLQVLQWDDARSQFLVLASDKSEPGRFYIFNRQGNSLKEIVRRVGWIEPSEIHPTTSIAFTGKEGAKLTGYVTVPQHPRVSPPPLLVYLHDMFQREQPEFNRRAQAMAQMGFVVLRLNYRGSAGFGFAHLNAVRQGFDRVPLEDVHAALEWMRPRFPYNPKRVAIIGQGYGGYVALRALQLFSDEFRCGIAIDPLADLSQWTNWTSLVAQGPGLGVTPTPAGSRVILVSSIVKTPDMAAKGFGAVDGGGNVMSGNDWAALAGNSRVRSFNPTRLIAETRRLFVKGPGAIAPPSVLDNAESLTKPLLILTDKINPEMNGQSAYLHAVLERKKIDHDYETISDEFLRDLPDAQYGTYDKIEEFLNLHIYDFKVNLGEATKVKE